MNTEENSARSDTQRLAEWILKLAKGRGLSAAKLANEVGKLSSSYFIKLRRGDIEQFPFERIDAIAEVLGVTVDKIFEVAEVEKPRAVAGGGGKPGKHEEPLYVNQQPDKLKFIFQKGVPDHCWPMIALKKKFFQDVNIELDIHPNSLSAYPESQRACASETAGVGDTLFVMPLASLGGEFKMVTPIAVTHHYHGFPFIGRSPSKIKPVADSSSTRDFDQMMLDLADGDVLGSKSVACVAKPEQEFLKAVWRIARLRPLINVTSPGEEPENYGGIPPAPSESFLEELWEIGCRGRDFVVGHAMSLAIALKNTSRYKVVFDFESIKAVLDNAVSEAGSRNGRGAADSSSGDSLGKIKKDLEALRLPVALVLNTKTPESVSDYKHGLILRLHAVAKRTVDQVLRNMSESVAEEMLEKIQFPASNLVLPEDHPADADSFLRAWKRCYSFDETSAVVGAQALGVVSTEMEKAKEESRKLIVDLKQRVAGQPGSMVEVLYRRASRHFDNFNFFDARRYAQEGLDVPGVGASGKTRSAKKV